MAKNVKISVCTSSDLYHLRASNKTRVKISIKLESNIFYGSATTAQSIPLLVSNFDLNCDLKDWSTDLECTTDVYMTADVYHETRPGFESFIEVVETNSSRPDSNFAMFHLKSVYRQYSERRSDGHFTGTGQITTNSFLTINFIKHHFSQEIMNKKSFLT